MKAFLIAAAGSALLADVASVHAGAVVFSAAGASQVDIQTTIEDFRLATSESGDEAVDNGVGGGPFQSGLRHIDWDVVPSDVAKSERLPGDFFSTSVPVGANLSTLGTGLRVSALPADALALRFGDLEPSYTATFAAYGVHRLFAPVNSTVTDIRFSVPGSPETPAVVNGFGAIFADVDQPLGLQTTLVEYWDISGQLLGYYQVPPKDNGVSFLGVHFDGPEQVARVRITSGNIPLVSGVDDGLGGVVDLVAMGQFFYSEPMAIPEPTTRILFAGGLAALLVSTRRNRGRSGQRDASLLAGAAALPPGQDARELRGNQELQK